MGPEMKLLELSLQSQGWIQPILVGPVTEEGKHVIIDGFHRHLLLRTSKAVWAMTGGKAPVVVLDLPLPERMLLTIRINRAKGNHAAIKMHEIVASLVNEHQYSPQSIAKGIGADLHEIETLLAEDVFEKKQVDSFAYSRAWVPPTSKAWGMLPIPPTT